MPGRRLIRHFSFYAFGIFPEKFYLILPIGKFLLSPCQLEVVPHKSIKDNFYFIEGELIQP